MKSVHLAFLHSDTTRKLKIITFLFKRALARKKVIYSISDINECLSAPCKNGGLCYDRIGKYLCECRKGFNGALCETGREILLLRNTRPYKINIVVIVKVMWESIWIPGN